jgi:RNA polymerase sigma-70 factor (ECF subfamily)
MSVVALRTQAHDERQLIHLAKRGDTEAFGNLYALNRRRVFSLCLRMTDDWSKAEELTQDTFLQAYRKLETFRGDSAFSTWLHRIAVNVVLMYLRHNRARLYEVPFEVNSSENEESLAPRDYFGRNDTNLDGSIDRVVLQRAIRLLPPGYGVIFVLHDVEGYEHHEIAEMLGCTIGNTKSQLHKARLKIRRFLRGESMRRRSRAAVAA